jgi:hypothetical protein
MLAAPVRPLSSERALEPVRQDSSVAEKQESRPALLLVVRSERLAGRVGDACLRTTAGVLEIQTSRTRERCSGDLVPIGRWLSASIRPAGGLR